MLRTSSFSFELLAAINYFACRWVGFIASGSERRATYRAQSVKFSNSSESQRARDGGGRGALESGAVACLLGHSNRVLLLVLSAP